MLNLVEQWVAPLLFALQPKELALNMSKDILTAIPHESLQYGIGVREPLAESFSLREFPMKGSPFEQSEVRLKRAFYQYRRALPVPDRAAPYLAGELFDGDYYKHGQQYRFHFGRLQFEIKRAFVDSLKQDTIWVRCELGPIGEIHLNEVVKGANYCSFVVWDVPVDQKTFKSWYEARQV